MCNNVRNGFKDEKCPKRLSKAQEQAGLTWEGRCEPLREVPVQRKPGPAQATPPRKAPRPIRVSCGGCRDALCYLSASGLGSF